MVTKKTNPKQKETKLGDKGLPEYFSEKDEKSRG